MNEQEENDLNKVAVKSSFREVEEMIASPAFQDFQAVLALYLKNVRDELEFNATPEDVLFHRGRADALRMALSVAQLILDAKGEKLEGMPSEEQTKEEEENEFDSEPTI